jgi:hypothetical protein
LLQFVEEALDTVALPVEIDVVGSLYLGVALWWDDSLCTCLDDLVSEMIGVVSFVSDSGVGLDAVNQVVGEGDVVALAGRTDQADREAKGFGGSVDLVAQAAAGPTQALGIRPPLILRAPAAC